MTRLPIVFLTLSLGAIPLDSRAAESRDALVFQVTAAVKSHSREALLKCLNLEGTDPSARRAAQEMIDRIMAWPSPHVKTTERNGKGPAEFEHEGKLCTMNGNWTFQIHILSKAPPQVGSEFVFPAGETDGGCRILFAVPK